MIRTARLARFFAGLAIKEHVAPDLHVRPLVAELFVTENCNLRCVSCNCWHEARRDELTTDEWKGVVTQLGALRFVKINFTGGEPLLRRDLATLARHARAVGIPDLHLNTNAILLDAARREELLDAGIRSFNVSVDGPDAATHDAVRGRDGAFRITTGHLEALLARRDRHDLAVRMNFTVLRDNVGALPGIAALAQSLRVKLYLNLATDHTFLFRAPGVAARAIIDPGPLDAALADLDALRRRDPAFLPSAAELAYVRAHFVDGLQRGLPCAESQLKLMVHSRGGIGGCWAHDPVYNVRRMGVREVIDSPHYRAQHARLFRKECVGCGSNYSLNLRWRSLAAARG